MEREKFLTILKRMYYECERENRRIKEQKPESKLRYEVLQFSDLAQKWDSVYKIADFYNNNWLGNKDFMHIPDFEQVLNNCLNYPIIIAREEGKEDILAISAIKYDENTDEFTDPYFPEEDARYFSITGILVNKDTNYRGMGKKIYEIALKSAYEYNKKYPGTRIMCVIDCRNKHSLRALATAVENINKNESVGKNRELPANIIGYYELRDTEHDKLQEAPTLVLEIGLDSKEKEDREKDSEVLEYKRENTKCLFDSLRDELNQKFKIYGLKPPVVKEDTESGMVYYYSLQKDFELIGTQIVPNGTEAGNNRQPIYDEKMHSFIGPIRSIAIKEESEYDEY